MTNGRFKEVMGSPEWAEMEIFDTQAGRFEAEDLLHMWLGSGPRRNGLWTCSIWVRGTALACPVNTIQQMLDDPTYANEVSSWRSISLV